MAEVLSSARGKIPIAEARVLLREALGISQAVLAAHPEITLTEAQATQFRDWIERRERGEPVAYLIGWREFYSRRFRVTPDVLIPRPETELLVDLAKELLSGYESPAVLDLGTGSGALAVTLALELPGASVTATDISPAALALARDNALACGAILRLVESDWFDALGAERYDLIVANPPYVAEDDPHLRRGDPRFEPRPALASGSDGLEALRRIAAGAGSHLTAGGWLLVEHGYDQGFRCRSLLTAGGLKRVESWRDLAGLERVTGGFKPATP